MQYVPYTVLVVAEDALLRLDVANTLGELPGVNVVSAGSPAQALAILAAPTVGLAVVDWDVGGDGGLALGRALAAGGIPLIIISGFGKAVDLPADLAGSLILEKPFSTEILKSKVQSLLAMSHGSGIQSPLP